MITIRRPDLSTKVFSGYRKSEAERRNTVETKYRKLSDNEWTELQKKFPGYCYYPEAFESNNWPACKLVREYLKEVK